MTKTTALCLFNVYKQDDILSFDQYKVINLSKFLNKRIIDWLILTAYQLIKVYFMLRG